ncbi:MAG: hypothetical protein QXE09_03880 [Thermoproteus sp.]
MSSCSPAPGFLAALNEELKRRTASFGSWPSYMGGAASLERMRGPAPCFWT